MVRSTVLGTRSNKINWYKLNTTVGAGQKHVIPPGTNASLDNAEDSSAVDDVLPLTLREEQRLRVFENRVLRRIFGPRRDETTGEWRRLHNEELHDFYSSTNTYYSGEQIEKNEMSRASSTYGERRGAYRILVGRPEGRRPLGRPTRRCEDNIKIGLQEVGWEGVDWIELAQDRYRWRALVNAVISLRVP
jgi:hypothetical protein